MLARHYSGRISRNKHLVYHEETWLSCSYNQGNTNGSNIIRRFLIKGFSQCCGDLGYFQHRFEVYGRENQNCYNTQCTRKIKRIIQAGRSSFIAVIVKDNLVFDRNDKKLLINATKDRAYGTRQS